MFLLEIIMLVLSNQIERSSKPKYKDRKHKHKPSNLFKNEEDDIDQWRNLINHLHEVKELEDDDNGKDGFKDSQSFRCEKWLFTSFVSNQTNIDNTIDNDVSYIKPSPKLVKVNLFNRSYNQYKLID